MSALEIAPNAAPRSPSETVVRGSEPIQLPLAAFGKLTPISRPGGQGRVYRPADRPAALAGAPVVVKLYRRPPPSNAAHVLAAMVAFSRSLEPQQRTRLRRVAAWPLAIVGDAGNPVGIAMDDATLRFAVPFVMPSGRREHVLMSLEHLLGSDAYLRQRGLDVQLNTAVRAHVAERICDALAFLHRHGIVASDIAPNNLLVAFRLRGPAVCFIDCDSMVFRGQQALAAVETGDWQIPAAFGEPPQTRAADAYKLGLLILRLFARSHDAHTVMSRPQCVPTELHGLLRRALGPDAANRPPAGEWQRALRQLLSAGALDVRYPGPEPQGPAPMRSAGAAPMRSVGSAPMRSAGAAPSRSSIPAHRRASAGRPPLRPARGQPPSTRRSRGRHDAVTFAWMVVAAVVFVIILARLAAAAVPSPAGGGFAPGPSGGGAPSGAFQYYYHGAFSPGPP